MYCVHRASLFKWGFVEFYELHNVNIQMPICLSISSVDKPNLKCGNADKQQDFVNFVRCDRSSLHHHRPQLVRQRTFSHFQSAQCHRIKKVIQNFLGNKFDNFKILIACVHSDRTCLSVKRVPSKVILALEYLCVVPLPLNSLRWPYLSVWFKWHKPNFCWH